MERLTRGTLLRTAEFKELFTQAPQSTTNLRRYLDNDRTTSGSYVYGSVLMTSLVQLIGNVECAREQYNTALR